MKRLIDRQQLAREAAQFDIVLTREQLDQFSCYAALLVEWNQKINLTAITNPQQIVIKHFIDSALMLNAYVLPSGAAVIDVGTGAGFPGVVAKIVRPDIQLTLLDSLNKRVRFLEEVSKKLGQENVCVHGRAEELGQSAVYREAFDVACARAVSHMRELSEYCLPFVKKEGQFIALKGADVQQEISESKGAIKKLGGGIIEVKSYVLPDASKRNIVLVKKISHTSTLYPRKQSVIIKKPLM